MFSENLIEKCRLATPGVAKYIHLNNAGAALMPTSVLKAIQDHLLLESQIGGYEAASFQQEKLDEFFIILSKLVNAQPRNIAYAASATDAYNRALSSIPIKDGDTIITTEDDYVSNQIAFLQIQKRYNIQIHHAKVSPKGGVDLEDMERLIKEYHPKLVAVTHIPTNSGLIQDVEAIGDMCRQKDIWYVVDACQSAGQLPLDVKKIHCDFLSATFRKFLRGPRGAGFLYVSDKVLEKGLEPLYLDLHSAAWTSSDVYTPVKDGRRFELWERPHALVLGSTASARLALELGLNAIAQRTSMLAQYTRELLDTIPKVRVLDQGENLGGIVTFHVQGASPNELKEKLKTHFINTSTVYKTSALFDFDRKAVNWASRVSPHYYNTKMEIEKFAGILKELI